jgi:hypothetical protein
VYKKSRTFVPEVSIVLILKFIKSEDIFFSSNPKDVMPVFITEKVINYSTHIYICSCCKEELHLQNYFLYVKWFCCFFIYIEKSISCKTAIEKNSRRCVTDGIDQQRHKFNIS